MAVESDLQHGPLSPSNSLQRWNESVDAINENSRTIAERQKNSSGVPAQRPAMVDIFMGVTTESPPNGASPYTDARYWVTRSIAPANFSTAGWDKFGSLTDALTTANDPFGIPSQLPAVVTATNIAELPTGYSPGTGSDKGPHGIPEGTVVFCIGIPSRQNPCLRVYYCFGVVSEDARVGVGTNLFAGFYNGTIYEGDFDSEESDDLDLPQGLTAGASVLLVVTEEDQNVLDSLGDAPVAAQRLKIGSYVVGPIIGISSEEPPRPIVWVRGGVGAMDAPTVLTPGTYGAANTDTWSWALNGTPVTSTKITSWGIDVASKNIWFNTVTETYDARGLLRNISAETQTTISLGSC